MLQPRRFKRGGGGLLAPCLLLILITHSVLGNSKESHRDAEGGAGPGDDTNSKRDKRDDSGLTTVLLVNNDDDGRSGRNDRPSGILTSTARTFVHDGTTTEYRTQVIGTTLDHGRYYAQLLHTSSRIYFGGPGKSAYKSKADERAYYKSHYIGPSENLNNYVHSSVFQLNFQPTEAIFIYPTKGATSVKTNRIDTSSELVVKVHEPKTQDNKKELLISESDGLRQFPTRSKENGERELLENLIRLEKVDLFNKRNVDEIKPTNAFSNLLPTVTIRHDFAPSGFSVTSEEKKEETVVKSEKTKPRSGKSLPGKPVEKKYDTVTYLGFADFVTTVGNTVIVFMPSTTSAEQAAKQTLSNNEVATQKPEQQVKTTVKTFLSHSPGMVTKTVPGHGISMQTSLPTSVADRKSKAFGEDLELKSSVLAKEQIQFENPIFPTEIPEASEIVIEPSESMTYSSISRTSQTATEPLATFATTVTRSFNTGGSDKPLGLLRSIGGTKAYNGTTTHFTSLIYGTYVDGSYAQILKTSSSVFYVLESPGGVKATVTIDGRSSDSKQIKPTSAITTPKPTEAILSPSSTASLTTTESDDELLETSDVDYDDYGKTTSDGNSVTTEDNTEANEVKHSNAENEGENKEKLVTVSQTKEDELITRLIPSTVYKTFTYLTTFFIPADETTTTSIRSREVVTSDINLITKIIDPNLVIKEVFPTSSIIIPTKVNTSDADDVDEEFRLPAVRILAPKEAVIIEDTEDENTPETTTTKEIASEEATIKGTPDPFTQTPSDDESTDTKITDAETALPSTTPLTKPPSEISEDAATTEEPQKSTEQSTTSEIKTTKTSDSDDDDEDEEVEVVFKTLYTTYTYLTTYFHESSTTISSSEVVVTNVITSTLQIPTELKIESSPAQKEEIKSTETPVEVDEKEFYSERGKYIGDGDEIQPSPSIEIPGHGVKETPILETVGLKTLYTTYTYLTTFFEQGSTDVKSRIEVVTNVVGPNSVSVLPSSILQNEELLKSKFEMLLKEQQSQRAASLKSTEAAQTSVVKTGTRSSSLASSVHPNSILHSLSGSSSTYPGSATLTKSNSEISRSNTSVRGNSFQKSSIRPSTATKGRYGTFTRKFRGPLSGTPALDSSSRTNEDDNSVTRLVIKGDKKDRTVIRKRIRTKSRLLSKTVDVDDNLGITTIRLDATPVEDERIPLKTMITDVKSSSTSGGGRQIRIAPPEPLDRVGEFFYDDQISSESNTDEIEPSPTLILQTSYTTFTYFTTVYKGTSSSDIISRLETVTNIVTETAKPELLATQNLSPEDATLPITYFTTFTYWTTLYKDGNTIITSREETVSNVVTPTIEPSMSSEVEKTGAHVLTALRTSVVDGSSSSTLTPSIFVPAFVPTTTSEPVTEQNKPETPTPIIAKPFDNITNIVNKEGIIEKPEPTTYYTTYTYFTTSYIGDSTVLKSRLETVTSVIIPTPTISEILENDLQTGRAIHAGSAKAISKSKEKETSEGSADALQTGLLSTVVSTSVNDGKTTLYSTDVFGTFIDGLYAKVLESTTKVISDGQITPSSSSEVQKTGIVSINEGKIVDALGISTTFFTTKAIGTSIEQLYAQVVESTTSVLVDNEKKSALASLQEEIEGDDSLKTGLVRLIEGSIIQDGTITLYESRVIGTVVDGTYAQIIESTSSYKIQPSIAPSVAIKDKIDQTSTVDLTSPSPSAVEGSIIDSVKTSVEENEESDDDDEEGTDDDNNKGRVKSRLTFQSKKRTFTPVIRPFASRNRPTFLPKKKPLGTTGAQTITRANFTPTITATLATKTEGFLGSGRNRFGSGRKTSPVNLSSEVKVTATNSRKFGRNRSTYSSPTISSTFAPSRGRGSAARVSPTPSLNLSSTRARGNFRSTSTRANINYESGGARPTVAAGRPRIRPTLSGLPGRSSTAAATNQPNDKGNDLTTVVTEEDEGAFTQESDNESLTTTAATTTEDPNLARRNNNPLLRFRRPLVPKASTTTTTPKPTTTQAPRRGILNARNNRLTVGSSSGNTTPRNAGRVSTNVARGNLPGRSRPANNLFPPRGLFKKPAPLEVEKEEEEFVDENDEEQTENEDSNYDESTAEEVETEVETKPTIKPTRGKTLNPVNIRPFNFQKRTKRQIVEYGSRTSTAAFTPRYRRPKIKTPAPQAQERIDYYDEEVFTSSELPKTTRNGRPYTSRGKGQTYQSQVTNPPAQSRIRPTTATSQNSQRAPFTLREKDANANLRATNFRRGQNSSSRRKSSSYKTTEATAGRKSSRGRSPSQNQALNDLTRSNQRRGYSSNRRVSSSRTRGRFGDLDDIYTYQPAAFDGTITVTHRVPSEVTIPIVSGKVTEYRNVLTAKPSIEVLGPHQYTVSTTNGGTVLYLNRENTETLNNGVTEVTKFLIHETPTTSVIFTPTTIRGRKTSFSHVVPSTVYDVENVVTTIQPQIGANAPLANILLSQLLLGNLNIPPNQPLAIPQPPGIVMPTTEYKTRTTTYVTSVTDHISTVLPITFRGKEILTTIVDNSVNVITATEFITDTIVVTPTVNANQQINSLLLPALLQAQLLNPNQKVAPQQLPLPALTKLPFPSGLVLDQLKYEALQHQDIKLDDIAEDNKKLSRDNDIRLERESDESNIREQIEEIKISHKPKSRKKSDKKRLEPEPAKEIITLYVSGRRPGEFSTILSTVISGETSVAVKKREAALDDIDKLLVDASEVKQVQVLASKKLTLDDESHKNGATYLDYYVTPGTPDVSIPVESKEINSETQSLESVLGDVSKHVTDAPNATPTMKEFYDGNKIFLCSCTIVSLFNNDLISTFLSSKYEVVENEKNGRNIDGIHGELRYNLATKVMGNGVEVIVATDRNPLPMEPEYLRHLSSTVTRPITLAPHTLTNHMSMVLPTEQLTDGHAYIMHHLQPKFVPKTYYTIYNYKSTVFSNNTTSVTETQTSISNVKMEPSVSGKPNEESAEQTTTYTIESSPTLQTEVFQTAYTFYNALLDGDQPVVLSSTHTVSNTLVGNNDLEPSEVFPTTNTYLNVMEFTNTLTDGTDHQVISTKDVVTQVVVTGTPSKRPNNLLLTTNVTKTYFVTYTYFSTYVDGDKTKIKSDVSVSSDVTIEKFYIKPKKTKTATTEKIKRTESPTNPTSTTFPFSIRATRTYLTTFTYYTTLLQGVSNNKAQTKVNSRTKVVENVVTEAIPQQDIQSDYLVKLNSSLQGLSGSLVATATLKRGETILITAYKNAPLVNSYQKYEITPTAVTTTGDLKTKWNHIIEKEEESKTDDTPSSSTTKSKFSNEKPSKSIINQPTAEALVATEETLPMTSTSSIQPTPTLINQNLHKTKIDFSSDVMTVSSSSQQGTAISSASDDVKHEDKVESSSIPTNHKPETKKPSNQTNVNGLLTLNKLGINGMNVLGPVFNAMAELINNKINKNSDALTRRNDTASNEHHESSKKPVSTTMNPLLSFVNKFTATPTKAASDPKSKETTPRRPVYIPVGSFAEDSKVHENKDGHVMITDRRDDWYQMWKDIHAKNFDKIRPHDNLVTILEGGIPISPGQVITTNSDVIIGRPGESGPRPPNFAIKNNIPVDMKPPPIPNRVSSATDGDHIVGQYSTNKGVNLNFAKEEFNIAPPLTPPLTPTPSTKNVVEAHGYKNVRPKPNEHNKNGGAHVNGNFNKNSNVNYDSGTMDLNPPPVPPRSPVRTHGVYRPVAINHKPDQKATLYKSSQNVIPIPVHLGQNQHLENYVASDINPPLLSLPTVPALSQVHQESIPLINEPTPSLDEANSEGVLFVPAAADLLPAANLNLVDRSTVHPFLVNIQPSQVANVVIPHGSSTALVLNKENHHSLKGQVIDDPSPHPGPETVGFVGVEPVLKLDDDITTSIHNEIVPAESGEVSQTSSQISGLRLANRPHLSTETIRIRPQVIDGMEVRSSQNPVQTHESHLHAIQSSQLVQQPPFIVPNPSSLLPVHSQTSFMNHQPAENLNRLTENGQYSQQNPQVSNKNNDISGSQNVNLHVTTSAKEDSEALKKYRNEQNINFDASSVYYNNNGQPNSQILKEEFFNQIRVNQDQNHPLTSSSNAHSDQIQFPQVKNPTTDGNGGIASGASPGRLSLRPSLASFQESHSSVNQQPFVKETLANHEAGTVHDVPLVHPVHQSADQQKEKNPVKQFQLNFAPNKHDMSTSHNIKPGSHFEKNQNHLNTPTDFTDDLSPPPLPEKETFYRPQRPLTKPTSPLPRHPSYPHGVPPPLEFMIPPPESHNRLKFKSHPETHQRPLIPIGAGAPQQNYGHLRPEDMVIVPNKKRPGFVPAGFVNNIKYNHHIPSITNVYYDLDASDTKMGLVKTKNGETLHDIAPRPSNTEETVNANSNANFQEVRPKPLGNTKTKLMTGSTENTSLVNLIKEKNHDLDSLTSLSTQEIIKESKEPTKKGNDTESKETFNFGRQPPRIVTQSKPTVPERTQPTGNLKNHKEFYSNIEDHKQTPGFSNHKEENFPFESLKIPQGAQNTKKAGSTKKGSGNAAPTLIQNNTDVKSNVKAHEFGSIVPPRGTVRNENRAPTGFSKSDEFHTVSSSQQQPTFVSTNNDNIKFKKDPLVLTNVDIKTSPSNSSYGLKEKTAEAAYDKKAKDPPHRNIGQQLQKPTLEFNRHRNTFNGQHIAYPGKYDEPDLGYAQKVQPTSFSQNNTRHTGLVIHTGRPHKNPVDYATLINNRNKVQIGYSSIAGAPPHNLVPQKSPRPFSADSVGQSSVLIQRPSGFTAPPKGNTKKISSDGIVEDSLTSAGSNIKKPSNTSNYSASATAPIPPEFTSKYQTSFDINTKGNYGNQTINFYNKKPTHSAANTYTNVGHDGSTWMTKLGSSNNHENKPTKGNKVPYAGTHPNTTSILSPLLPVPSDAQMDVLKPPKVNNITSHPEEVMGLSPPPLERPRRPQRPQRPKPHYKFEHPSTPKSTLTPIAIENDFPPVRSPEFTRKPLKPQDIFPPRLPDNFVHHLSEYPIRGSSKPKLPDIPITSLPIDIPTSSTTEKSANFEPTDLEENGSEEDPLFAGSEINGHSKPILDEESLPTAKKPSSSNFQRTTSKTVSVSKVTITHQTATKPKERPISETQRVPQQGKQGNVPPIRNEISPTSTVNIPLPTSYYSKVSTSVTPTIADSYTEWQDSDIITGSETLFDEEGFNYEVTPSITTAVDKKKLVTALVSTGSTTIFGGLYTREPQKVHENKSKLPAAFEKESAIVKGSGNEEDGVLIAAPVIVPTRTTTLTVTTTMTTVVHGVGHKPSTKTIVLTKTIISTVFNKITETKTLVKPTTATFVQTHTIATTKTALVVPTALYPSQTKYPTGGTLKPEIFVADPHAKDMMTISVSSSMNKNHKDIEHNGRPSGTSLDSNDKDSILVLMSNEHPNVELSEEESIEKIGEDNEENRSRVMIGGVFDANSEMEIQEGNKKPECYPGCQARKNELCQKINNVLKCVCRPGFARMFPDRPCRPTYTYKVKLELEKLGPEYISFEKSVAQSSSRSVAKLASVTKEGLDRMIMQSELRDFYHGIMVNGFEGREKKTMVDFYVQLSENTDEDKLMSIFKQSLKTSNYSLGGTELFATREADNLVAEDFNECLNPRFHDCSEHARCFNLKGTYTCSCKEGYTDVSENSLFPGRLCSDTIGCEYCGYHGACYSKGEGQITCECFQWYSGERCNINLKVLLIALVTIGAILLALLLVCAVLTCLNKRSKRSASSKNNGYLRYRGPSSHSIDRRAMINDSSSESSVDNLPYLSSPPLAAGGTPNSKKPVLRHVKGPAPRPIPPPGLEQRERSVTVMIPRAKYRPVPPLSPHLSMSTFSPEKHLPKTAAQMATEQKLISYLDGNTREVVSSKNQSSRHESDQYKTNDVKSSSANDKDSPKFMDKKKESRIFEYEYKISNMNFAEETSSGDRRGGKSFDDRFRRHSDSTRFNSDSNRISQFRKYSAGALVSAGYEVSAKVGMHSLDSDTIEDEHSAIMNTHTMKSNRSQFTTLNRTGDHKTMSEARSYDETTVHPQTRSLKTHYSGSSPSSRANNDEGHTMIERDLGSTFIMPESQLFKPEPDRGSDISNFDSL